VDYNRNQLGCSEILYQQIRYPSTVPLLPTQGGETIESIRHHVGSNRAPLDYTDSAITDCDFRIQIFSLFTSQYAMILVALKHRRPLPTPKVAMHDLQEEETTTSITKELGNASMGATPSATSIDSV
jgi:hypothetical protein